MTRIRIGAGDTDTALAHILAEAEAIARELHPSRPLAPAPGADGSLDRDFGLDSLARLELVGRVERAHGVTLGEQAVSTVETPAGLLAAVLAAAGKPAPWRLTSQCRATATCCKKTTP
ncbi:MAG: acyl carrier protein [Alphaproteobacteria bacterium]|nr:acyl carrier protein [Alphaproteobacteria bacterium]